MKKIGILIMFSIIWWDSVGQTNSYPSTGNVQLYQAASGFRSFDVVNNGGFTVSRMESTLDATGQLLLWDATGNYKTAIRSTALFPSAIAGELIVGEFTQSSKNRQFFVNGTAEFTGKLFGRADMELHQAITGFRAYDIVNRNAITVSRFEATTDATGQLWLKDADGNYKVILKSNGAAPSAIAGELVVGEFATLSKGKKLYVNGNTWMEGQLEVNGKIRGEEVKVEIFNAPDYVFEPDYILRTLEETSEYITNNHHLPEIPSAKEMETDGIDVGDMNMKLLKKIEELTLYQIQLLERVKALEKMVGNE
ncbi:MAG: hypothetical protein V7724_10905 [Sediminicola sp.]